MAIEKSQVISFFVSPLYVRQSDKEVGFSDRTLKLRNFQQKLLEVFKDSETKHVVLLSAPTGSGKTLSLLIPLLVNLERGWLYFGSMGVYPSKELAKDQMISISNLLLEMGAVPGKLTTLYGDLEKLPENKLRVVEEYVRVFEVGVHGERVPVVLLYITSDSLRELRQTLDVQSNFELLSLLWKKVAKRAFRIAFTVPEYPYLLATEVYQDFHRAGVWLHSVLRELYRFLRAFGDNSGELLKKWLEEIEEKIGKRKVFEEYYVTREFLNKVAEMYMLFRVPVFFDEFHLYSSFSLASFLSLLWIYMVERGVGKIVVSSATPEKPVKVRGESRDFLNLVERLATSMGYTFLSIEAEVSSESKPGFDQVRKKLEVRLVPVVLRSKHAGGASVYGLIQRYVGDLLRETDWLERYREKGKSMIIVDRFASVLEVADAVKELTGRKPLIVASSKVLFSDAYLQPSVASLREANLVVGNMAIAFGIDVKGMDLGVVAAKDFPSVVQKVGRFGRGGGSSTAVVYLLIPFQKLREANEKLGRLADRELTHQEFIELLGYLYPRGRADIFVRSYVWVLKAVLPCWVYVFATIVRLRSEMREKLKEMSSLSGQSPLTSGNILGIFASYLSALDSFLSMDNLFKKLASTVSRRINLPPVGLYNFYSFRGLSTVTVKREVNEVVLEEDLGIATVGRNIPIEFKEGEFRVVKNRTYEYSSIWLGTSDRVVERKLWMLNGYVVTLRMFAEVMENPFLYQEIHKSERRRICKLTTVDEGEEIWNAPVLVMFVQGKRSENLIKMLSAMDSAIPIYITSGDAPVKLVGGIYIL